MKDSCSPRKFILASGKKLSATGRNLDARQRTETAMKGLEKSSMLPSHSQVGAGGEGHAIQRRESAEGYRCCSKCYAETMFPSDFEVPKELKLEPNHFFCDQCYLDLRHKENCDCEKCSTIMAKVMW